MIKQGTRVQLSKECKRFLRKHLNRQHLKEFCCSTGTVIGHPMPDWPEWDVMWDERLRYAYRAEHLKEVPRGRRRQ